METSILIVKSCIMVMMMSESRTQISDLDPEETIWMSGKPWVYNSNKVAHLERSCSRIREMDGESQAQMKKARMYHDDLPICLYCLGEEERHQNGGKKYATIVKNTDPEEVFGDD